MKTNATFRVLAAATLVASVSVASAQENGPGQLRSFLGWMPMQPVTAGGQLLLDMHRFYFAKPGGGEELVLPEPDPDRFTVRFNNATYKLSVDIGKNASGLVEIPIRVVERVRIPSGRLGRKDISKSAGDGDVAKQPILEGVILVGVQPADGYTFTYYSNRPGVEKINVAGQFNGWNPESHPLQRTGEGDYGLFVPLPPGPHPYKLVIDGQWALDAANPEKLDDGTGNENSVARVGLTDRGRPPVVY
ncbi:MAG: glycogen-binding domain-containing protein, partial [Verrucomicrobia bacterium]|nr:glycogen-binding domain-containing protein [Verrucomicrobiota bacterium]